MAPGVPRGVVMGGIPEVVAKRVPNPPLPRTSTLVRFDPFQQCVPRGARSVRIAALAVGRPRAVVGSARPVTAAGRWPSSVCWQGGRLRQDVLTHVILDTLLGAASAGRVTRSTRDTPGGVFLFVPQGSSLPVKPPGLLVVHQVPLQMPRSSLLRDHHSLLFLLRGLVLDAESGTGAPGALGGAAAGFRVVVVVHGRRKAPGTWPWG